MMLPIIWRSIWGWNWYLCAHSTNSCVVRRGGCANTSIVCICNRSCICILILSCSSSGLSISSGCCRRSWSICNASMWVISFSFLYFNLKLFINVYIFIIILYWRWFLWSIFLTFIHLFWFIRLSWFIRFIWLFCFCLFICILLFPFRSWRLYLYFFIIVRFIRLIY